MNVLLIYPEYPATFWSFKYALSFINKKASLPPLGLLTVASFLPKTWNKKLVDLNVSKLKDLDIEWADCVFISGMIVQRDSAQEIIDRVKTFGKIVVAGGPLFSAEYENFTNVDSFVLNEAEDCIPELIEGLCNGDFKKIYSSKERPDLSHTPVPDWSLINIKDYASIPMQISRGCPYNCDFCNIVIVNGKIPRLKSIEQVQAELDAIYNTGWRGSVFIVDDNFIGNYAKVKQILRGIIQWMDSKKTPFTLSTEAPITLADNIEILELMKKANFVKVFVGIETPDEEGLKSCGKTQNMNRNLIEKVKFLQQNGLEVQGGFIVGFDTDTPKIFDNMIKFIQGSGIVTAMVGLLHALPDTTLYKKLQLEKRIVDIPTGNNTDYSLNFLPKMNMDVLMEGYKKIQDSIFAPKLYYKRVKIFLKEYKTSYISHRIPIHIQISALTKSFYKLGIREKGKYHFWKVLIWTLFRKPKHLPLAITMSIYGYHFRQVLSNQV
ncbi:MAG: Fe-S oxidoreductase [Ignavibacteria bacterium]|nr:Fe-S oxidoreductase [Ignavibacteria bacterium]